jgi:hypothetical protein
MIETAIVFAIFVLMLLVSVIISGLLVRRATFQVIDRFCSCEALDARKAKTAEDLGLAPRDAFQRMFRTPDYKPYALQSLSQAGIVSRTQKGKLYMIEERLADNLKCDKA